MVDLKHIVSFDQLEDTERYLCFDEEEKKFLICTYRDGSRGDVPDYWDVESPDGDYYSDPSLAIKPLFRLRYEDDGTNQTEGGEGPGSQDSGSTG